MRNWDDVSAQLQLNGTPLSALGYCKITFDARDEEIEELASENENLQIAHDVMFARIRNNNGPYTPDEVSQLIDGELLKRETDNI